MDKNPSDLDITKDNSNREYVYNSEDNTWKNLGVVSDYQLVDRDNSGLVFPELYNKIISLKDLHDNGLLRNTKLTNDKYYFYYFNNSDKFLIFNFENNNIRIEINKQTLKNKLAGCKCYGHIGLKGSQGLKGRRGLPAPSEKFRYTNSNGNFDILIETPLNDQPISIRGFKNNNDEQIFESLIFPDGSIIDIGNNISDIKIDGLFNNGKVNVSGKLNDPSLRFKIRQRGQKGNTGKNGVNYVEVNVIDSEDNGDYYGVVGMFRYNNVLNSFVFKRTSLNELLNNVITVQPKVGIPIGNYWSAVEITSERVKSVEYHNFTPNILDVSLDLPSYTPLSGCYNQARYTYGYLNWSDGKDLPFNIITDNIPKLTSCKDPFWFCGNSGNMPCDDIIDVNPIDVEPPIDSSSTSDSTELSESSTSETSLLTELSTFSLSSSSSSSLSSLVYSSISTDCESSSSSNE